MIYKKIKIQGVMECGEITTYILENFIEYNENKTRPLIIICPGGGYEMVSDREAEAVAIKMNGYGYHSVVLKYSIAPIRYPEALIQLARTINYFRDHAKEYNIDINKIVVAGFSAGGHLAANIGVTWHYEEFFRKYNLESKNIKPNAMLLSYPVISSKEYGHLESFKNLLGADRLENISQLSLEDLVSSYAPKTFIWHTNEDGLVLAENSLNLALQLRKHSVPVELHLFTNGGHGLSLGTDETSVGDYGVVPEVSIWPSLFDKWLKANL